ncbi:MAG: M24 family metallopeptidase [Alphaproteobacteria bacterium]|jgi:Xaa-Pro aminopeptidase|nr:M24 family metallopeptidase [Alphaproteobacteria bacterium]
MFQSFEASAAPEQGPPRLAALRAEMAARGLDGFLVPRADAHQGEYVAPCDDRLSWLTGFTGSAGFCAALRDIAGVFVDGRYRVQVRDQVALPDFTPVDWPETQLGPWLCEHLPEGKVGFDPWLHTVDEVTALRGALSGAGLALVPTGNLVDAVWTDRPAPPDAPFFTHATALAGESAADKRTRLARELRKAGHRVAVLTLPDSIGWLLNIRGADIPRNPVPQSFALLFDDGHCQLFARPGKAEALADHLGPDVAVLGQEAFLAALTDLDGPVRLDPASCPQIVADTLAEHGVAVAHDMDPCVLPKAIKTPTEISGTTEAHLRDGAAMCRFLHWLDETAPKGALTEIDVARALEGFRRDTNALRDISFDTICGAGPHGAIVHYRVTEATNRPVTPGDLLLIDSGGQYLDGTTDITRTMATGPVGDEEKACFTRVLQGMIALSRARFPTGIAGRDLDSIARYPLWLAGLDYGHGTGHGVGVYMCVHEGPQGFTRAPSRGHAPLQPGMILSNEPGYYREGAFGIRLENLVVVQEAPALGDNRPMLCFDTLTWVPLDRRLIEVSMLTEAERLWIDRYHADTVARIGPRLDGPALDWLEAACAPL